MVCVIVREDYTHWLDLFIASRLIVTIECVSVLIITFTLENDKDEIPHPEQPNNRIYI